MRQAHSQKLDNIFIVKKQQQKNTQKTYRAHLNHTSLGITWKFNKKCKKVLHKFFWKITDHENYTKRPPPPQKNAKFT